MELNTGEINDKVLPNFKKGINCLEYVAKLIEGLDLPLEFSYKNTIKNMPENIRNIKDDVSSFNNWLEEVTGDFIASEGDNEEYVRALKTRLDMENFFINMEETATTAISLDTQNNDSNHTKDEENEFFSFISNIGKDFEQIGKEFEPVGAWISSKWNSFMENEWPHMKEAIKPACASVANLIISLISGVLKFIESLIDFVAIVLTWMVANFVLAPINLIQMVINLFGGYNQTVGDALWGRVMSFVAEDWVGEGKKAFYKYTETGKWLDNNAIESCKSTGTASQISEGIGYIVGIVLLTIATCGVGGAAVGGTSAVGSATTSAFTTGSSLIAGVAATGKYTEKAWGNMRDSSMEGIQRKYESGEITKEQYESIINIRNLSEEQWAEIEEDYKKGELDEEKFKTMKKIREIPQDWKTGENRIKGIIYGVANGVWEGIQWYLGGKLAGWAIKGHAVLTSTVRVAVDTSFNAADTPFRTLLDTVILGKEWNEAWEEEGGWESMISSVAVGFIGSVGGEIVDQIKLRKITQKIDENEVFSELDDTFAKEIKDEFIFDYQTGKIKGAEVTDEVISKKIHLKQFEKRIDKYLINVDDSIAKKVKSDFIDLYSVSYLSIIAEEDLEKLVKAKVVRERIRKIMHDMPDLEESTFNIIDSDIISNPDRSILEEMTDAELTAWIKAKEYDCFLDWVSNGDNDKALKYLKTRTDVQCDAVQFRKMQFEIFEQLKNKGMDEYDAGLKVTIIFDRIIYDIGWDYLEIYDGVKIYILKGCNSDTASKVSQFVKMMPDKLKENKFDLYISHFPASSDTLASVQYKMEGFRSAGYFDPDAKSITLIAIDDALEGEGFRIFLHEAAHNLDNGHVYSDSVEWGNAMRADASIPGNDIGCSDYATSSFYTVGPREDFADAVALFCNEKASFKARYPNRYKYLVDLLE